MPLSKIISGLIKFFIQALLFFAIYFYFLLKEADIYPNYAILLTPYLVILMAGLGLGAGIIISSLTTKYRDLKFLISFGVQLLMYATPVIYQMSVIPDKYRVLIIWNPMAHIIETARYMLLNDGTFSTMGIGYAMASTFVILLLGILIFNKTEKSFIDTV